MLFMCHQLALKKEASDKQKAEEQKRAQQTVINVPIIWVLGGPGCGKGTQCAKIVEKYGFTHLSTGDLLRDEVASGSDKGRTLSEIMKSGALVPNEEVLLLLEQAITRQKGTAKGFLIDGYPREKDQGVAFENRISAADLILFFDCSDNTMTSRILARANASAVKRADDNEETIKNRLRTFRVNTNSILDQYTDKTITINAERDVDIIFDEVVTVIDCILKKKDQVAAANC